ncbi:MAG: hypothetical protein WBB28_06520 [Crinalium sp.]
MVNNKDKNKERLTVDLKGLRARLERQATEPGQPIGSIVRMVLLKGLEVLEAEEVPKTQDKITAPSIAQRINGKYIPQLAEKSGISQQRLEELTHGAEPLMHELSLLEPTLGVSLEELYAVYKRDFLENIKQQRGKHPNGAI